MKIKIKRIEGGKLPEYKTIGSAGADCYARVKENVIIQSGKNSTIPLGFAVEIPDGYEMQIRGRSGLASKSEIEGFVGTIDSDYRGEVSAILFNHSDKDFIIKNGDRIAQAIIAPIIKAEWNLVDKLSETERGEGGFGHTGISEEKKIEKFYEPFTKKEEVEKFIGKDILVDNRIQGKVDEVYSSNGFIYVLFKLENNPFVLVRMNLVRAFERVKIDDHRFGREIKQEE